jgi:IS1 family transposase
MRGLRCQRLQVDELWTYVGKKQNRLTPEDRPGTKGDVWTFVAIDADTKLVPCYHVGDRSAQSAKTFLRDLAGRVTNRCQLSADALAAYVQATEEAFGKDCDFGQIVKIYEAEAIGPGRYSPPRVIAAERKPVMGMPEIQHISTSFVERQNLTMRMSMRRFTRLTNAFSKKVENLKAAIALHFVHYNFARIHRSLRVTPAMAAGVSNHVWGLGEIAALAE